MTDTPNGFLTNLIEYMYAFFDDVKTAIQQNLCIDYLYWLPSCPGKVFTRILNNMLCIVWLCKWTVLLEARTSFKPQMASIDRRKRYIDQLTMALQHTLSYDVLFWIL